MGRAPYYESSTVTRQKKGPWTPEEDLLLMQYIQTHGEGQWRTLPLRAGLQRCGKGCRLRWMNYLRPNVKRGNISLEEEDLITRLHKLLGNRWSLIAGRVPGRTDNEIKNHWNSHLSKKLRRNTILHTDRHYRTVSSHLELPMNKPLQPFNGQILKCGGMASLVENSRCHNSYVCAGDLCANNNIFKASSIPFNYITKDYVVTQQENLLNSSHFNTEESYQGYTANNIIAWRDETHDLHPEIGTSIADSSIGYWNENNQGNQLYYMSHDPMLPLFEASEASLHQNGYLFHPKPDQQLLSSASVGGSTENGFKDFQEPPQLTWHDELLSRLFDESTMDVGHDIQIGCIDNIFGH